LDSIQYLAQNNVSHNNISTDAFFVIREDGNEEKEYARLSLAKFIK